MGLRNAKAENMRHGYVYFVMCADLCKKNEFIQ